jgi:hypothetical protein
VSPVNSGSFGGEFVTFPDNGEVVYTDAEGTVALKLPAEYCGNVEGLCGRVGSV